jgi:hypothetical protein
LKVAFHEICRKDEKWSDIALSGDGVHNFISRQPSQFSPDPPHMTINTVFKRRQEPNKMT